MNIYCCGIGGIGLSAYAALQKSLGHSISGSDRARSLVTDDLELQGISIHTTQDGSAIPTPCDLFVYSEAIPEDAAERKEAKKRGIRQLSYPAAVGELSKRKKVIAVCGTHGKSSTTALLTRLFLQRNMDPTVIIGTRLSELDGRNWRKGNSDWLILEACEYCRSFMNYEPQAILLTNCDGDHFDYYKDETEYKDAFAQFIKKLPEKGIFITHGSDPDCTEVSEMAVKPFLDADAFPLVELKTPGLHMRQNAQLVLALAETIGIPVSEAKKAIEGYSGSWRRMESKGKNAQGVTIYDDYAHHPREIRATLSALREKYTKSRIVCVFQPHTHHRTLALYDAFVESFSDADLVIIPGIYAARADKDDKKVNVASFCKDISAKGTECLEAASLDESCELLKNALKAEDIVVCMGAGDITSLATKLST